MITPFFNVGERVNMGKLMKTMYLAAVVAATVSILSASAQQQGGETEERFERLERRIDELEAEAAAAAPAVVRDWLRPLRWDTQDGRFSLGIQGRLQPRYSYEHLDDERDRSSFRFRRIRVDLRGHAYDERLTFRLMPEISRSYSLRDGWLNYEFLHGHGFRAGQYNIPAFLERSISTNRHAMLERSTANDIFQWPTGGRDIGLMSHGSFGSLGYATGVFGGGGRNNEGTDTSGHLFSGRFTYAFLGSYPRSLALTEPVEGFNLAAGAGGYYANNNALQHWSNFTVQTSDARADAASMGADITLQHGIFTGAIQGFYWEIDPGDDADTYYGTGYSAEAGVLILAERLFAGYRHSWADPNHGERTFRQRENALALTWYHFGHGAKLTAEFSLLDGRGGERWNRDRVTRIQYQFLF